MPKTSGTAVPKTNQQGVKAPVQTIIVAAMMLFSMFFGAGNLIFPPLLGAASGENFSPAVLGFLATGVLLPVLGVLAIAITGRGMGDLASRGGKFFGIIFPILVYLSIGAFYALPRTATVSFSTAITPVFGWDSWGAGALFSAAFFGVTLALAYNPSGIVDRLGKYLTPALIALLLLLITLSMFMLNAPAQPATEEYAEHAFSTGFINGYMTMDSLAALAFGIVLVSALKYKGLKPGAELVRGVSISGIIAGILLGAVYVGLAFIGRRIPARQSFADGAALLSEAARQTMGAPGAVIFGLIVLLACLTTSVGLLGATSEYFAELTPRISYRAWTLIFAVIAFGVSTLGLEAVLKVAAPIIGFLYPAAIVLILLTLLEPVLRVRMHFTFIFSLTLALMWAALMTFSSLGWGAQIIEPLISWAPGAAQGLGWFVPTLALGVLGFVLDLARKVRVGTGS